MSSQHSYEAQVAALAVTAAWPLLALGLAVGSRVAESIPHAVRARIAGRGPKAAFTSKRLEQARAAK